METEVEGISKGVVLQGGEPEEGLVDDLQEGDVDEGGDHEGEDEVIENFSCRRWHVLLGDKHGQEEGEGADHAEEKDYEEGDEDEKYYLKLMKTIRQSPLLNLIFQSAFNGFSISLPVDLLTFVSHIC